MAKKPQSPTGEPGQAKTKSRRLKPPSDLVPNTTALAAALDVSASTIKAWKRIPGCPMSDGSGRHRVSEWMKWVEARKGVTPEEQLSKAGLEMEILKVKLEDKRIELEKKKGVLVLKSEIVNDIHASVFAFRSELESVPGKLAPQVVGLPIAEAELRISTAISEALMKLHREEWRKQ